MKKIILASFVLSTISFHSFAESLTCKRVVEVEGRRDFVYEPAPVVPTRVPSVTFMTVSKKVKYKRQNVDGTISTINAVYTHVPPSEEFEGNSLGFVTENGPALMNFAFKSRGRYLGSSTRYLIGEFYEGDLDSTSWTYLCPLKLKSEIEL